MHTLSSISWKQYTWKKENLTARTERKKTWQVLDQNRSMQMCVAPDDSTAGWLWTIHLIGLQSDEIRNIAECKMVMKAVVINSLARKVGIFSLQTRNLTTTHSANYFNKNRSSTNKNNSFSPEMFNIHIMVAVSSYGRFESVA